MTSIDFNEYEIFLRSMLSSDKLKYRSTLNWTEEKPEFSINDEYGQWFDVNDDTVRLNTFRSTKIPSNLSSKDLVERLEAQYYTFVLSNDYEDEFQKRTLHENVLPYKLTALVYEILEKIHKQKG